MSKDLFALILAGGSGSRLWPMSRDLYPKQLLKLNQDKCLFESTFLRLVENFDDKNIISITNIKHEPGVRIQLKELKDKFCRKEDYKIITEPLGRNTAPAIALAIKYIKSIISKKVDPIILVVPSDHLILDNKNFSKAIEQGTKLAENGFIATFGIKPNKIDTGFGYIKTQKNKKISEISESALKVAEFKEKPDFETAKTYVESGKYYWNGGIFMFKASVMIAELKKHAPEITTLLNGLEINLNSQPTVEYQEFNKMPDISIDYAVMEQSKKIALVPLDCDWNDLGSWEAIYDISEKNKNGNCITGNVIDINSKNSMIYSTSKLVTTIGLEDTIVIETEDAILVCDKKQSQDVKKIYNELKERNDESHKVHKTVFRPWGYYTVIQEGQGFLTKCIMVNPKAKLSLQLHHHRSEHWVVLEGKAYVVKGENAYELLPGEHIDLAIEEVHSLQNPYDEPVKILEVQRGDILDENDIERLEDMYGRA